MGQALPRVFAMATELLKHHAASPAEGATAPSTEPCLKLVNAALSWDFTTVSYTIITAWPPWIVLTVTVDLFPSCKIVLSPIVDILRVRMA